jgi:hypothetical protein
MGAHFEAMSQCHRCRASQCCHGGRHVRYPGEEEGRYREGESLRADIYRPILIIAGLFAICGESYQEQPQVQLDSGLCTIQLRRVDDFISGVDACKAFCAPEQRGWCNITLQLV